MIELGISQAQMQFTKLLAEQVMIVDKKNKTKKAVILPYAVYEDLLQKSLRKEDFLTGSFSTFKGILSNTFATEDKRYHDIVDKGQ